MLTNASPGMVPPGGLFTYVDSDSGIKLTHPYFSELLKKAKAHRIANNFPIGLNFNNEFEHNVCTNTPSANCKEFVAGRTFRNPNLNARAIYNGTKVVIAFKSSGSPLVSEEEAERRARICSTCPANLDYKKPCGSGGICQELVDMVTSLTGNRKTSVDSSLKACAVCKCVNKAQIWMPLDILWKGVDDQMNAEFPENYCWKKRPNL